jgi:ABC-type antimicrobial peptide transport system permease subunit
MALGATRGAVAGLVVRYGLKLAAAGLATGLVAALALTRVLASFLYGVQAVDPVTFALVPGFTIAVALAACLVPAWRAAGVDPVSALRRE